jgi:hypothetical protein
MDLSFDLASAGQAMDHGLFPGIADEASFNIN